MSESRFRAMLRRLREEGDTETFEGMDPDGDFGPWVTPDDQISARVDGTDVLDTKLAALARHRSQVETDGPFFRGAENGQSLFGEEFYRLAKGTPGPGRRRRLGGRPVRRSVIPRPVSRSDP